MQQADPRRSDYLMGRASWELERLRLQATILEPITRRLLTKVSLGGGQRVLDIGCGTGDVSSIIAALVGPGGEIVGIDVSPVAIERAKKLQPERSNLSFRAASLKDYDRSGYFDLIFGRYVLVHQSDPSDMLRRAAKLLRPGGALAFHEIVLPDGFPTSPGLPTWDRMNEYYKGAFREHLPNHDVASSLVACFKSAGLGAPQLFAESLVGDAATSIITSWFAGTIRTLLPGITTAFGVSEADIAIDTLADRLRAEAESSEAQVFSSRQVAAWLRI